MHNYKLKIIPKPKEGEATVLVLDKHGKYPTIKGQGKDNLLCGICGNIICENIDHRQIENMVFKCPNCESYNLKVKT